MGSSSLKVANGPKFKKEKGGGKKKEKESKGKKERTTDKKKKKKREGEDDALAKESVEVQCRTSSEQAIWLSEAFHSALGSSLSLLELDPIPGDAVVQLQQNKEHTDSNVGWHVKYMLGSSWEDVLIGRGIKTKHENKEKGSPVLLILCSSAIRCVELLKGLRVVTKNCKVAKLFAKHIKVEEQVSLLEDQVDVAAGTPNRVRKLVDIGALNLDRLSYLLVDMHKDVKGFTMFTMPQVKIDFWNMYKECFHERVLGRKLKICLY